MINIFMLQYDNTLNQFLFYFILINFIILIININFLESFKESES